MDTAFIAFFWLRQPANYVLDLLFTVSRGRFPYGNDETILARYLEIDTWSDFLCFGFVGLAVFTLFTGNLFLTKIKRLFYWQA